MSNESRDYEPQGVLEVREWKAKASEEIERIGFKAYLEQCHADPKIKALREEMD
jgi:hypothetical protein